MDREKFIDLLRSYRDGKLSEEDVLSSILKLINYDSLKVRIDGLRELRRGYPETVFCLKKTPEQALKAFEKVFENHGRVLATKATAEHYHEIKKKFPEAEFFKESGIIRLGGSKEKAGYVPVVAAGTSDYPVCEEAYLTLDFLGSNSEMLIDVGVSGIHRLEAVLDKIQKANCVIVCAGMEGALPSLVAGISPVPVIGVPTSVGYGASFGGITPLLAMLNSCAEGLAVVNIDNGFGAAVFAHMVNMLAEKGSTK